MFYSRVIWIFSLRFGLVKVNPIVLTRNFQAVVFKVSSGRITIFIHPFSPETIPKRKPYFGFLIGFFSVWRPQPSAPKRENRPRLKTRLQKTVALCWHAPSLRGGKFGIASEFFSDKVVEELWAKPPPGRLRILADGAESERASFSTRSLASCAADNLWQSSWLHFLSRRFKWSTICHYLVRNISWKYKIVK